MWQPASALLKEDLGTQSCFRQAVSAGALSLDFSSIGHQEAGSEQ